MIDRVLLIKDTIHIQLALARYGPLLCSFPVWDSCKFKFWQKCEEVKEDVKGHHTMLLVGYDRHHGGSLIFRNTLGQEHGDFGYIRLSFKSFVESQATVILCADSTKPQHGARVPWTEAPEKAQVDSVLVDNSAVETGNVANQPAAAAAAQQTAAPLIEDSLIREAKKKASDFVNARGGLFQAFDFDPVGFKFPSTVGAYTILSPGQSGVACIGFTAPNVVKAWDASASGYYVYLNQSTQYVAANLKDTVQLTLSTNSQIRWQVMHAGNLLTAPATLSIVDQQNKTVSEQTILISIDVKQTTSPKVMRFCWPRLTDKNTQCPSPCALKVRLKTLLACIICCPVQASLSNDLSVLIG